MISSMRIKIYLAQTLSFRMHKGVKRKHIPDSAIEPKIFRLGLAIDAVIPALIKEDGDFSSG